MKKTLLLASTFFLVALTPLFAEEEIVFQSGPVQTSLVQLFTSDASPACNPALDWMSAQKNASAAWKNYIPVAMHVKAWDSGGYKDAFTRPEFDTMLSAYKRAWNTTNVYPPTMVANGVEWSGWSRGQDVPQDSSKMVGTLSARTEKFKHKYEVEFKPGQALKGSSFTLHACLLSFGLSSRPSDGKNRGKVLTHDFIAILYRELPLLSRSGGLYGGNVEVHPPKGLRGGHYAVVFWITESGANVPLQAAGGLLPE